MNPPTVTFPPLLLTWLGIDPDPPNPFLGVHPNTVWERVQTASSHHEAGCLTLKPLTAKWFYRGYTLPMWRYAWESRFHRAPEGYRAFSTCTTPECLKHLALRRKTNSPNPAAKKLAFDGILPLLDSMLISGISIDDACDQLACLIEFLPRQEVMAKYMQPVGDLH